MRRQITTVYQLKIVLLGVRPQIVRRVQVPADMRLDNLHMVVQVAMGWTNSHLHSFSFGKRAFTIPFEEGYLEEMEMEDERSVLLSQLLTEPKAQFEYEYDFGDGWQHVITLEKILSAVPNTTYPLCLDGKRACPPEDCGGVWGYSDLLKVLANPAHPDYKEMKSWIGRKFDPELFDLEKVNRSLRRLPV